MIGCTKEVNLSSLGCTVYFMCILCVGRVQLMVNSITFSTILPVLIYIDLLLPFQSISC